MKEKTKTVAIRLTEHEFAKAYDGLVAKGIPPEKLMSNSGILRAAILVCCLLTDDPKSPATEEATNRIKQLWKTSKRSKKIDIDNLY